MRSVIGSEFLTLRAMINHCSHPEQESYQGGPWAMVVILVVSYAHPLAVVAWPWVYRHASSSSRWRGRADPIVVVVVVVFIVLAWTCCCCRLTILVWMQCRRCRGLAMRITTSANKPKAVQSSTDVYSTTGITDRYLPIQRFTKTHSGVHFRP